VPCSGPGRRCDNRGDHGLGDGLAAGAGQCAFKPCDRDDDRSVYLGVGISAVPGRARERRPAGRCAALPHRAGGDVDGGVPRGVERAAGRQARRAVYGRQSECVDQDSPSGSRWAKTSPEDVDDVIKCLYPWCVADHEYDHSGVHSFQKNDALNVSKWAARRRRSGPPS
jgi:hypothetical protein